MGLKKFKPGTVKEKNGNKEMTRKEERKNAKKLKKLQAKAFAERKTFELVMREDLGLTKEEKKRKKRKRQRETKKFERKQEKLAEQRRKEEGNDSEDSDDEDDDSDAYEEEEAHPSERRDGVVEVIVNKGKRKYGDESSDSDDDLTYEQYLKEVEQTKRKKLMDKEGIEEDEAAIRKYGVLLGLSEKKKDRDGSTKVPKAMKSDGLDMLLEFCDTEARKSLMEKESGNNESGEDEEPDDSDEEEEEDVDEDENVVDLSEGEEESGEEMVDEMVSDEEDDIDDEEDDEEEEEIEEDDKKTVVETEDIYGRKINKQTGELIKFDPAAAKRKLVELDEKTEGSSSAEQKAKVDRAVTGIINRLSEATLIKSQQAIAELWAAHSKNDVKSALCKILTKVLSSTFRVQDSLLTTYGAFIAMCHTMISNEISAHFVEVFLCDMVKLATEEDENAFADDKSIENRVVFVSMLVVFRIIQPSVLLELIDKYSQNLTVSNLQSIYLLVSYTYKPLKKTTWSSVVEKIESICIEFAKKPISSLPRAKFLLEQFDSLKKQPPKVIDYTVIEHQVKVLHGLSKKKGSTIDTKELGMSLNDLLNAESRGRWWVVGSAFRLPEEGGYGLLSAANQKKAATTQFPANVVELAGKAGMNSEIRRNIFCSVATSEDEDEAFEKLLKLSLKGEKERELVHVLIVMMTKEKTFNQFYAALLQRFCEYNRRFLVTLQFALWDRLRECDSMKPFQRSNLTQLMQNLIANEVLPITTLKSIEWATRWPSLTNILKKLFIGLSKCPESVLKRVFEPLTNPEKRGKFELLSEGMRVFWHMHMEDSEIYKKVNKWIMESGYD